MLVSFLTMAPRLAILFLVEQGMQQKGEEGWGRWWGWWYMEMEVVVVECPLRRAPWSAVLVQNAPWWSQFFQTAFFRFFPSFLASLEMFFNILLERCSLFFNSFTEAVVLPPKVNIVLRNLQKQLARFSIWSTCNFGDPRVLICHSKERVEHKKRRSIQRQSGGSQREGNDR